MNTADSATSVAKTYAAEDCDPSVLKGKKIAVIGYGSQGHAHAQNMKDSGHDVIIGLYDGSKSWIPAHNDGFEVYNTDDAVQLADIIIVAIPDTEVPETYECHISPFLKEGKTLGFCHGLNVHYGLIEIPEDIDVIMVAPKGPGHTVRSQFLAGKGVPSLVAIHQNASEKALDTALAWAAGIGASKAGIFQTTFKEETETDLFGEQAVLCGGLTSLVLAGYETLVEAGYQPEMAYFECVHELKLIVDLIVEKGIEGMRFSISETAEFGDYITGPQIIDKSVRENMQIALCRIQNGEFVLNQLIPDKENGSLRMTQFRKEAAKHPIEKVGARLRGNMSWINNSKASGTQAEFVSSSS